MLFVAASKLRRTRIGGGVTEDYAHPDKLPEVTIPSIHIAYHLIRRRIVFVNEAFSLGIKFPRDHIIRHDNWHQNPKIFFELRYIDFMIFEIAIKRCLEGMQYMEIPRSHEKNLPQYHIFVSIVSSYSCLIEKNWRLFQNDFSKELDSLR